MRKKLTTTTINVLIIVSAVLPFLLFSGCTQQINPETNTVSIENLVFNPSTLTVSNGTVITWMNNDNVDHTIVAESGLFSSGTLTKGDTFTYTFVILGNYTYFCSIHPSMRGTIIVQ